MKPTTHSLPQQTRLATFEPASFNPEARTVEVVWTVGARVKRYDYWNDEWYEEELDLSDKSVDMGRLQSGAAPVLDSHRVYAGLEAVIGVVEKAWIKDGEGRATLRLSSRDDIAGIVKDIADGIVRNISVGYAVRKYQITREAGKIPVYRAIDWEPRELSFVTVGADAAAGTRSQSQTQPPQGFPCEYIRAETAPNPKESTMDPKDQPAADDAARAAEQHKAAEAARAAAAAQETQRAVDILDIASKHGYAERAGEWIKAGKTVDQVRADILDEMAKRSAGGPERSPGVTVGKDEADKFREAGANVLLARSAVVDPTTRKVFALDGANPLRGATLLDMARMSLERAGVRTMGLSKLDLVGRAFTQNSGDFPILLENAMNKSLLSAYAIQADTWSRFCRIGTVSDFRAHTRYRTGSIGDLDSLTEGGEFLNKTIPDGEKASITASTKGNLINLTRQAIINDDLGAFVGLAADFGRAAKRTIENAVYALLASNPTVGSAALFHASHGNLGTAGAPSVTTFDEARSLMAKQKDVSNNDYLDLRPAIWVGPTAVGGTARVVNAAEFDPDTANKLQKPNSVRGLVRDIVDTPRITTTYWYMFADPNDAPVIEVAFLDGQSEPYLELQEGFEVDGSKWKARLDFGVAAIDYRGAVRNNGS